MRRRAWLALLLPGAAQAQSTPRRRPPPRRPAPPAAAPIPPQQPTPAPAPPPPPPPPPIPLPAGMQALPSGGWRILLTPGATSFPPAFRPTLAAIAERLTAGDGRVTLISQAPGAGLEPSFARRLSLERGLSIKDALAAAGLPATRIDIRPMGRQPQGIDAVDIIPPGAPR